jgi:MFS family permease
MFAAMSFVAGPLYERLGAKVLLVIGSACIAAGPFLISIYVSDESYTQLIPGLALMGTGIGLFYPTATTVGVTAVQEARRSLAGAIVYMFQIAGGSVGLGLTTTVFIEAGSRASGSESFIDGFETAFRMDSLIAVGGFLIAVFLIGGAPHLLRHHRAVMGPTPRGHGP